MELIVSACKSLGITPILITQATLATPGTTPDDRARIDYDLQQLTFEAIVRAFSQTYDIIRDIGARTDTQVIDVASTMNGRSTLFADHVHTTPAGSRELARLVADALRERLKGTTEYSGL